MGARERPGTSRSQVSGLPGPAGFRGDAGGKRYPRLLRGRENVDVGRQARGLIECADADEAHGIAGSDVIAPNGDFAGRAPGNPLALAALTRRLDDFHFTLQHLHPIRFDHGIQGEGRTRLSLAP